MRLVSPPLNEEVVRPPYLCQQAPIPTKNSPFSFCLACSYQKNYDFREDEKRLLPQLRKLRLPRKLRQPIRDIRKNDSQTKKEQKH